METTPLPTTLEEAYKYASKNGRIVPWAGYGEHIDLTCKNHPDLRWSTKNINCIGARNIFFSSNWQKNMASEFKDECQCSGTDLELVVPNNWQEKLVPLRIVHCGCCKEAICEENSNFSWGSCKKCFDARCGVSNTGPKCK